ncbi:MAG TPA: hypothetical protein VGN72_15595 [Tepidisphaeraceae bacterium]|jgi:hypothetical protein|nr:hypothetical protein [Tepidisphaeraceae bacterium]
MDVITQVRCTGALLFVLFVLNFWLPRWFDWRTELPRISRVNEQIVRSHAAFIALMILLMSAMCLLLAEDLMQPTRLARSILGGLTLFWFLRLLAQWVLYDWSLWRGHGTKTFAQIVATLIWLAVTATFAHALWTNLSGPTARAFAL